MHILVALTYYRPHYSGLTIYAELMSRSLVQRGHQVTVLTSRYDRNLPPHEIRDGVEVIRPEVWFNISKGVIMPSMPIWAWKLIQGADIVQLHVPQFDAAPIALLSRLRSRPVVLTYHCDLKLPHGFVHRIANTVSNLANHITARSANVIVQNTRDYSDHSPFLQRYRDKVVPIYPPIEQIQYEQDDIQRFRSKFNLEADTRYIGIAARLASEKGVEYLARAMPEVLEKFPNTCVLFVGPYENVVGESEYSAKITPLIESLNNHWKFLGILTPVEKQVFFDLCEVTVLPSINSTESYGMVQVESIACGTPVISTDLPGVRVPVELTGMGRTVPPEDSRKLAQALIDVLDGKLENDLRPESIVHLSTPDHVAQEYERIYYDLLERR